MQLTKEELTVEKLLHLVLIQAANPAKNKISIAINHAQKSVSFTI